MVSEQDEAAYWAGKASDAHHNVMDTVQASAGKWQAAIAAFLGAYATIGFVVGPTTIGYLPSSSWKYVILAVLGLAGLIAFVAVILANKAAEGFPRVEQDLPMTGPQMAANALAGAKQSRKLLRKAIAAAAVAGGLAILGSYGILANGILTSPSAPSAVLSTRFGVFCGTLTTKDGVVYLSLPNGSQIRARGGSITVVTSCGNS
jgi:hypothetical protein